MIPKTIGAVFALAAVSSSAPAPAQQSDNSQFQNFVGSSDLHKTLINRALSGIPPAVFQRCAGLVSKGSHITILKPVSFGSDGVPNAGVWKEAFPVSGCGDDTILNFYFSATSDEKINTLIGFPGTTAADPVLQRDAMKEAIAAASRPENRNCHSFYVTNTRLLGKRGKSLEGTKGPPWDELWTLSTCAIKARVTMHFVPEKIGTNIHASLQETKFLTP